ncbi:MAG TPA: carboxymuconolactone decarboxylase family protein [Baekduia sp.]|nr:carboxymuconolactone decarboxylase family protein [Baekduia sp.]
MPFVDAVPEDDAPAAVRAMYDTDRSAAGTVPNYTRAFSHRPEVYAAWRQLNGSIKAGMDPRRYELATLAAARRLRSSYCALAHGSVLLDGMVGAEQLTAIAQDHHAAGLDAVDIAVMDLADKVADDATTVTQADIDRLRALGLSDTDVFDVIAAASARSFFSKALDALGTQPDVHYTDLEPAALREQLTVGRPIGT